MATPPGLNNQQNNGTKGNSMNDRLKVRKERDLHITLRTLHDGMDAMLYAMPKISRKDADACIGILARAHSLLQQLAGQKEGENPIQERILPAMREAFEGQLSESCWNQMLFGEYPEDKNPSA